MFSNNVSKQINLKYTSLEDVCVRACVRVYIC